MKVTLPQAAVEVLKEILSENEDKAKTIRVYFAGFGCSGAFFAVALDEKKESDLSHETEGLTFIMDKEEYEKYGDVTITDTGHGFLISVENMPKGGCSCDGGCTGCDN
ncbi:iron-sulfur cluster biosynthesis family protein [Romboutsia lituseburensis]|uniref:iron-sulfur cluster biosynthesis family protein n=1 Tax=Romboutsia lituseburensis TaxID=1537 RepID=UPI00215ABA8B|nr:iron-sulfur cluster biosynthesis family protein [Romboutsia lituseburensis]MCR8746299.1 Fe-S cluster assembly protein HesB [Romboutsia lituseburensis]